MDADRLAQIEGTTSWTAPEVVRARDELVAEVRRLQDGIRAHRADITVPATTSDWKLWSLLLEEADDGR